MMCSASNHLAGRLLGWWDLVAIDYVYANGERAPGFGPSPQGVAVFDSHGRFIITVMRSDRRPYIVCDRLGGNADENRDTATGTITYFGTYTVDEAQSVVPIHVVGSSFPNWTEKDQQRRVRFEGDRLVLISPGSQAGDGWSEVMWQRTAEAANA